MRVLIVEHNADLGRIWGRFLERRGIAVDLATNLEEAVKLLRFNDYDALVLQLVLPDGGAIAISDYATYRNPDIAIITVTNSGFFSDGSVFDLIPNARSMVSTPLRPDDLAAMIEHFTAARSRSHQALRRA
ncbi:MAG: response regulator [Paracoccaceae bacterium]|nr:MAG: response regulator [Alphaproteobacteria bacterium]GIX12706.1 MAG: response regulator [Paracoccaceae bacterium]